MRQLLKAGVHFGHQTRYWSPSMAPYIFGARSKIHIINLEKTLPMLKEAMNYLGSVTAQGGSVLFVGTKRPAGQHIREWAQTCGSPFVDSRWLGGMLTNFKTVKKSIARLKELEKRIDSGSTARLSKKESLSLDRERGKLDKTLSGIKNMGVLPNVLFIIDVEHEYIAVAEANKLGIPVVAVVDSNCSPKGVDYIIPGNDDSNLAIRLYLQAASDAINESRAQSVVAAVMPGNDEYVEVDHSGAVISAATPLKGREAVVAAAEQPSEAVKNTDVADATENKPEPKKVIKKVAKKTVIKKEVVNIETEEAAAEKSDASDVSDVSDAKKKVTKKVAKKVTKKAVAAESTEESDASGAKQKAKKKVTKKVTKKVAKKAVAVKATEKAATGKTAAGKTAAGKTATEKTAAGKNDASGAKQKDAD